MRKRGEVEQIYRVIGRRIAEQRRKLKMTQAELGRALKSPFTAGSISNIENAHDRVTIVTLLQIADVLNCYVTHLLDLEEEES